jgi:transposase
MTNEKLNNSKVCVEQVASTKAQTIKLGLDVHADSIMVVRIVDHSAPQPAQKFTPAKFREWVKGQRQLAQAVHSCYEAGPFGYGLHRYLVKLGVHNLVVQPVCLDERLEVFRRLLAMLTVELDAATAALEAVAPTVRPRGLGGLTYEVIEREVGDWGRFANRRQVASYTGLCGGVSASGQSHHLLSITKHGNVRLRTALVELAWRLVIWQKDCKLVKKWWPVLGQVKATKAARKKAIVAIARQLAVDCWRWRTGKVTPQALGWVMVGSPA